MSQRPNFPALLRAAKAAGQDFEWYPTTGEIIAAAARHIGNVATRYGSRCRDNESDGARRLLDIGAGNGKVLLALQAAIDKIPNSHGNKQSVSLFAIEKSAPLIASLPPSIGVMGTEFWEQSLWDKCVEFAFCNPPYSEFEAWAARVIEEIDATHLYLVLPQRWEASDKIADALRSRRVKLPGDPKDPVDAIERNTDRAEILGAFDFANAEDRKARAKVHLLYIPLGSNAADCVFARDFAELLGTLSPKSSKGESEGEGAADTSTKAQRKEAAELCAGRDLIQRLEELYRKELAEIRDAYASIGKLDRRILKEIEVTPDAIQKLLFTRLKTLKNDYWKLLFDHLGDITRRLTTSSREEMLRILASRTNIDFNAGNAYAVILWAIKKASSYLDQQLLDTWEKMAEKANVYNYKSNQRAWQDNRWRYNEDKVENSHFALEFRMVCERIGGIHSSQFGKWEATNGLEKRAADFLSDVLTVANNLGFESFDAPANHTWEPGKKVCLSGFTGPGTDPAPLVEVRAFLNGNLHLRFHKKFMLALNVEVGRLKGWVHSAKQAAAEFGAKPGSADAKTIEDAFGSHFQLLPAAVPLLPAGFGGAEEAA